PEILKKSVPGCDNAEFVDFPTGRQLKLIVSTSIPGLKGPYNVYLQPVEIVAPSRVVLKAEPHNSMGSIKATCTIDLIEDGTETNLNFNANAIMDGKIAATPDMIVKGAVKVALDQFFKNFGKQISKVTA
ncbi:MAG TPA: SRPBCC domain-containing protein, partial [Ktedonobacteraceae bacterium]|nr:SRPBCC domain-containing protein [Ktedonobacteraceae bacterium]